MVVFLQVNSKKKRDTQALFNHIMIETRALQAKAFNDPDSGFDVLVASDAVGMGLNL